MSEMQAVNGNNSEKERKVRARKYGPEALLRHSYSPMQVPIAIPIFNKEELKESSPSGKDCDLAKCRAFRTTQMSEMQAVSGNSSEKERKVRAGKYGQEALLEHSYSPMQVPVAIPIFNVHPHSSTSSPRPRGRGMGRGRLSGPRARRPQGERSGFSVSKSNIFQISIANGEDICKKIRSEATRMHQNICIVSAIGCVSEVTMRHEAPSPNAIKYEGQYKIQIMSGMIFYEEIDTSSSVLDFKGGLSTILAGINGHTISGLVSSDLIANGSVKVLASSFS